MRDGAFKWHMIFVYSRIAVSEVSQVIELPQVQPTIHRSQFTRRLEGRDFFDPVCSIAYRTPTFKLQGTLLKT